MINLYLHDLRFLSCSLCTSFPIIIYESGFSVTVLSFMGLQNTALFPFHGRTPKSLCWVFFLYFNQSSGCSLGNQCGYGISQSHGAGNWKTIPTHCLMLQNISVNLLSVPLVSSCLLINRGGDLRKQCVKVTPKEQLLVKFLSTFSLVFVKICRERQCETDSRHVEKKYISTA